MNITYIRLSTRQEGIVCEGQGGGCKRQEMEEIRDERQGTKEKGGKEERGEGKRKKKNKAVAGGM